MHHATYPNPTCVCVCVCVGVCVCGCLCKQEVSVPEVLYEEVIEVDERVILKQEGCHLPRKEPKRIVTGNT